MQRVNKIKMFTRWEFLVPIYCKYIIYTHVTRMQYANQLDIGVQ